MCCYSALNTLHLYKMKQNWGYQLQAKLNHALSPLEAVDISFNKERPFIYQIQILYFVIGDVIL